MPKHNIYSDTSFNPKYMKFYYGIPHAHTGFSTGKGNPYEAYEHAKRNNLDFLIISDHNSFLHHKIPIRNTTLNYWKATEYFAKKFSKKEDTFLPLFGFECKTEDVGDLNIVNSETFFTGMVKDLRLLTLWILNNPNSFVSINHPHKNIKNLEYSPVLNRIITCCEVANGILHSKYTNHEKYYYQLLDAGWKLSAINGQDNHKMNFGDSENLTVYIGNDLNKEELTNAFRNHRTYSTESKTLKLYFTINNYFMGQTVLTEKKENLKFYILAEDERFPVQSLEIITNTGKVITTIQDINIHSLKYIYEHTRTSEETWYAVKVTLENNRTALSSPIFIENFSDNKDI